MTPRLWKHTTFGLLAALVCGPAMARPSPVERPPALRALDPLASCAEPMLVAPGRAPDMGRLAVRDLGVDRERRRIPLRFVQAVDTPSQAHDDAALQHSVDRANAVFAAAGLEFFIRANHTIVGTPFTHPRDADAPDYVWPEDPAASPVVAPFREACPGFVGPDGGKERPDWAMMRAATYCALDDEILVYVMQLGFGGQYPWYSRAIGMTRYHLGPGSGSVFAHEVGHYLGLPHTFPSQKAYFVDYDFTRLSVEGGRRYYRPHANLLNVETGEPAELSLFWDMVFAPRRRGAVGPTLATHQYFGSRAEASAREAELQPIHQGDNGFLCLPGEAVCGGATERARVRLQVSAGCAGPAEARADCATPAEAKVTGDAATDAFTRYTADPAVLDLNIMSYGYRRPPRAPAEPKGTRRHAYLSGSQIEQIHRVLRYDVANRFFPGATGRRPLLGRPKRHTLPPGRLLQRP